jgi:hypothetical protein
MLLIFFLSAFILGPFVEYWLHRLAHLGVLLKEFHWTHHRQGQPDGSFQDFRNGLWLGLLLFGWIGSRSAGSLGWPAWPQKSSTRLWQPMVTAFSTGSSARSSGCAVPFITCTIASTRATKTSAL